MPHLLGEFTNFPLLHDTVCKACNEAIGQAEEQVARSGPEAFVRRALGIGGRKGHAKVDPFQRGSSGAPPMQVRRRDPRTGLDLFWTIDPGPGDGSSPTSLSGREARQVVVIGKDGSSHPILVPDWMREPEQLHEKIRALDCEPQHIRWFADDDEYEWLRSLCSELGGTENQGPPADPVTFDGMAIEVTVTSAYFRAIAKAAFHYAISAVHDLRGDEHEFEAIRAFIRYGGDHAHFVTQERGCIMPFAVRTCGTHEEMAVPDVFDGQPWSYCHVCALDSDRNDLTARVQFFYGPGYRPPVYVVRMGEHPRIPRLEGAAHAFIYYPGGRRGRYSGQAFHLEELR